ncbi:MAG: TrbC/VirB2 family protein [Acidobacteria bacterium]|nr:TrbC/VirB2 family protein [Acidobacteriota bacterium]
MRWYQKAGLSFVFGTGALLAGSAVFAACAGRSLAMGLAVLAVGVAALFANAPWLPGLLRRRAFRAVIRMRRGAGRVYAAASAALAAAVVDPVFLRRWATPVVVLFVFLLVADVVLQATGPWEIAVMKLCTSFKTVIGRGLALVAVIIGGLMFAFGEGGSKSAIAGLIFGAGMILAAPDFLGWLGLTGAVC